MLNPQLDRRGELIHLLTTEGLPRRHVERLLDAARGLATGDAPAGPASGLPVFLCLPEDAARDRDACAAAAARLSLRPVALDARAGDALAGTVAGLEPGLLVLRHPASGAAHCAAAHAAPGLRIVNAGDGGHADPLPALALVQAMLEARQDLTNLAVALVGDVRHSRVARSAIHAMTTLGVPEVRAAGPRTLLPDSLAQLGVRACATLAEALQDADVIIVLPLGVERISGALLPSAREYAQTHGLTPGVLAGARSDALLLPAGGPTPGIEVDGDIAASLAPAQARLADLERHLREAALSVLAGGAP
ncbi:MAG: aspartate carbamoyltransferase [Achromobacter sp.]|uniref:aspartate carbamoyltransferase n=1 Tax=Achromobacter sp. TaxID=134375 RepID=UPI002586B6B4|nr:aspartate carbamoyltransferase [Achromobacter sp.]MCW0206237.1 aspartate carbamoyltransferase [Achromobacter sp.]